MTKHIHGCEAGVWRRMVPKGLRFKSKSTWIERLGTSSQFHLSPSKKCINFIWLLCLVNYYFWSKADYITDKKAGVYHKPSIQEEVIMCTTSYLVVADTPLFLHLVPCTGHDLHTSLSSGGLHVPKGQSHNISLPEYGGDLIHVRLIKSK